MFNKNVKKVIRIIYKFTIFGGAILTFSLFLKKGEIRRAAADCQNQNSINTLACKASEKVELIYKQFRNIRNIVPGATLEYKEGKERFKGINSGFSFSYPKVNNDLSGYLLLSKYDPNEFKPKIELWDLNKQSLLHEWNISFDKAFLSNMLEDDRKELRLIHPLLLEDGSLITLTTNDNAPLLRFDKCGKLKNMNNYYWFHHSIETDQDKNVYVPIASTKAENRFYDNYKNFKSKKEFGREIIYRDEAIAILDSSLKLKKIIPLDKIFHSIGLLNDLNSPLIKETYDPYHLNDVHPYINEDGEKILYLSMRSYGLLSYNLSQDKVEWVIRGLTDLQHDITPSPNKKNSVTIFDNGREINTPTGEFKGNTIVELIFPKRNSNQNTKFYLGRDLGQQGVLKKRIDFMKLPKHLVPNSVTQGRGRFLQNKNLFIEETNSGRAFEYDLKNNKIIWSYLNKSESGKIYYLAWSRYYEKLPKGLLLDNLNKCIK